MEPEVRKLQRLGSGQGRGSRLEAPGLWGWKAVWAECLGLPDWVVGNCRAHDGGNNGAGRQELADGVDADVRDVKEGKVNAVRVVWGRCPSVGAAREAGRPGPWELHRLFVTYAVLGQSLNRYRQWRN